RIHVRGLGAAGVEYAQEGPDLTAAVLGPLHDAQEVAPRLRADREQRLDRALLEPLRQAFREARQLAAITLRFRRALLGDDLGDGHGTGGVLGGDRAAQQVLDLVGALRAGRQEQVAG